MHAVIKQQPLKIFCDLHLTRKTKKYISGWSEHQTEAVLIFKFFCIEQSFNTNIKVTGKKLFISIFQKLPNF